MVKASELNREAVKNIGIRGIIASALVFVLTVAATCVGGNSTKDSIELQGRLNVAQAAKDFDNYLLAHKNTVVLAGLLGS